MILSWMNSTAAFTDASAEYVCSTLMQTCCLNRLPHLSKSHLFNVQLVKTTRLKTSKKSLTHTHAHKLLTPIDPLHLSCHSGPGCALNQAFSPALTAPTRGLISQGRALWLQASPSARTHRHSHTHTAPWSQPPSDCTKPPLWGTMPATPSAFPLYPLLPLAFAWLPHSLLFALLCLLSSLLSPLYS